MTRARHERRRGRWACAVLGPTLALSAGCFTGDEGRGPPERTFDFPTGLVVSPSRAVLYVVNSDYDLHYNGGTVQAIDLAALRNKLVPLVADLNTEPVATACKQSGLFENDNRILNPAPCSALPVHDGQLIKATATIGAFASGAIYVDSVDHGARLFVPVRGDPSVTWFNVSDAGFTLDCGQIDGRCDAEHRVGENPYDNVRRLTLPIEPIGIAAAPITALGQDTPLDALVTAHQTENTASLIENPWVNQTGLQRPALQFTLSNLPDGPTEVAAVPVPKAIAVANAVPEGGGVPEHPISYEPGFVVSYRATAEIDLLQYNSDAGSQPRRPFLTRAAAAPITVNSISADSRGLVVDGSERAACEASCDAAGNPGSDQNTTCLRGCVDVPLRLFVASRSPASLLIGEITTELVETVVEVTDPVTGMTTTEIQTSAIDQPAILDSVPLAFGASRVALGNVIDQNGQPALRVFGVAFDSRFVFSYDPDAHRVDAVIRTGRGPHPIAFDTCTVADGCHEGGDADQSRVHAFMYVGHFTDSYLGVVDLDMRNPRTFGDMFAAIGNPIPPPESK